MEFVGIGLIDPSCEVSLFVMETEKMAGSPFLETPCGRNRHASAVRGVALLRVVRGGSRARERDLQTGTRSGGADADASG